jgi:ferredoxin-NADP reductase
MKKIPGGVCSNYFHERVEEGTQIEVSHSRPFSLNKKKS